MAPSIAKENALYVLSHCHSSDFRSSIVKLKVFFRLIFLRLSRAGKSFWRGRLSTVNLLPCTNQFSLSPLHVENIFTFFAKQATLMRRSTVHSLPPKLVFPGKWGYLCHVYFCLCIHSFIHSFILLKGARNNQFNIHVYTNFKNRSQYIKLSRLTTLIMEQRLYF